MMQYDRQITLSVAGSHKATFWQAQTLYWSEMVDKLRTSVRGTETLQAYLDLPKPQQDALKDVGGFVGGTLANGRRKAPNVTGRDLLTLDLDNIPAGGTDDVLRRLEALGCAYAVYSTRKHEPSKPRLRVVAPLGRTATADEYEPLARKLADIIGISFADKTTFEASRLMYWPSSSADSEYVYHFADKQMLDVDGVLNLYADWRDVQEWPQVPGAGKSHVRRAAQQGDPTTKRGVIGAFCRQYDVLTAMEAFLPGIYTPTDTGDGRYTFVEGSTVGGAVLYDNAKFLYSHHATDPCSGKLVNAFDLVRLHKFGELDDEAKPETPVNKLPSFVQMSAFALHDAGVANVISQERYEQAVEDFGSTPSTQTTDKSWIKQLKLHPATAQPEKTSENILLVLESEGQLAGRLQYDAFADALVGVAPLPWAPRRQEEGMFKWSEKDDSGLTVYLEKILRFQSRDKLGHALNQCVANHTFNPLTDYLNTVQWDGVKRLDTLFIDYLGAADTPYSRAVACKSFVGAVARAMQPGIKYDTMPVLTGPTGLGKSTLIHKMGRSWFTDSIVSFEGKEAAELLQGVWLVEIGEMSAYNKSDLTIIKGFLSRTDDQFRAAYARTAEKHPRRCAFFGTSNRSDYLRDPTGGRRFLPVDVGLQAPTKKVFKSADDKPGVYLDDEVDQLWAEAVMYWRLGESLILTGELEAEAKRQQEGHREQDPREGLIRAFVERQVPIGWQKQDTRTRQLYWSQEFGRSDTPTEPRDRVCAAEIWEECFNERVHRMRRSDVIAINDVLESMEGWTKNKNSYWYGPYGKVKGGYVKQ